MGSVRWFRRSSSVRLATCLEVSSFFRLLPPTPHLLIELRWGAVRSHCSQQLSINKCAA